MKKILIADGHYVVRTGIAMILKSKLQYACKIDFAETFIETKNKVSDHLYDLLIIDIDIPESIFKAMVKELIKNQKNLKILVFAAYDENIGLQYIEEGAAGYLNKGASESQILSAVSGIFEEGYYHTADMMKKMVAQSTESRSIERLSNREFQIFKLLAEGNGNIEISNSLNLKMSTISTYKKKIFEKLQAKSVVDLVRIYDDMH
ncbi:response regulator transcription factor [Chryseobacterium sp. SSA4.19]|uniref:LuxR C-terminal-related transcriptional regulator n=1 Tax=Chryseobacterium sp. SSA4.19 TaxID=2919915 RepID=UPI001F4E86B3|nr:response regulator transcription factor [Chryseobacterium sp. SSA4.19]MCJ8155490.1 response regulator transcription factor [Chryseobacterium sp. SSA4.19]